MPTKAMILPSDSSNPPHPDVIVITPFLRHLIEQFRTARQRREQARGEALMPASEAEDKAALKLAWWFDQLEQELRS